jgi:hypothetical protein
MGTIYSQGNAPLTLLEAFRQLNDREPELARKLKLVFVGKWTRKFYSKISELGLTAQVEFISYLPHKEALKLAKKWDALALAIQGGIKGSEMVTPGRIYEYLYLKKPVLAMCPPDSDLSYLIKNSDAGEVVDYHNSPAIYKILTAWLSKGVPRYAFKNLEQYDRKLQTLEMMKFVDRFI